jgi:hypothetical protein
LYEDIAICAIPATKTYEAYITSNDLSDSFVVVPADLDLWTITSVYASYGQTPSPQAAQISIQLKDTSFNDVDSIDYTHPSNQRSYGIGGVSMQVSQGYTLNVGLWGTAPSESRGYTVTLTLEIV